MERIAPGAFAHRIANDRRRIKVLFQHGRDPQIGDKPLGPIRTLREDETGAFYEVRLLDAPCVDELLPAHHDRTHSQSTPSQPEDPPAEKAGTRCLPPA
jgi:HK97 family phage prohead protease